MNEQIIKDIRDAIEFFSDASPEDIDHALEEAGYSYYSTIGQVINGAGDLVVPWQEFAEEYTFEVDEEVHSGRPT